MFHPTDKKPVIISDVFPVGDKGVQIDVIEKSE